MFCMSEVIYSSKSLRAGSQVFGLLMFLCVILHTIWSGKSLKLLCILPFGMVCLSAISMFVKIMLAVCMLVGMVMMFVVVWCLALWLVCFVFSVMWSELLIPSAISCPLWSSVYECQSVECAFTSPVRTECGMFVMYCMQCCNIRVSCFIVRGCAVLRRYISELVWILDFKQILLLLLL